MDATLDITWEDGTMSRHEITNLPILSAEELKELLEKDLASYLQPSEMPVSAEGDALAWASVDVVDRGLAGEL